MSRIHRIPYPQPNDPLVNLPDLCIDAIFSYFSPIELIRVQRVGPRWRDAVNWRFSRKAQWKRWSPPLGTDDNKLEHASPEETALAFRRAVYRYEMRTRGEPTVIRKFTGAINGWTMCGDYFIWVDFDAINIQLVYAQTRGQTTQQPVRRFPLRDLFSRGVYYRYIVVKSLREQDTGVFGRQPLLGIVFTSHMDDWTYATDRVAVMDVVQRKILWCVTEKKGYHIDHCAFNQSSLSYTQYICKTTNYPYVKNSCNAQEPPQNSLNVLDALTGVLKSSTKFPKEISGRVIKEVRAHPVRELIFVRLHDGIVIFSKVTADWVGMLKLPILHTTSQTVKVDKSLPKHKGKCELRFDGYGPGTDARNTVSVCMIAHLIGKAKLRCWVIHTFEFPTVEELEANNTATTKGGGNMKLITSWKWAVKVIECTDAPISNYPWINLRSKQTGGFLRAIGRSTSVFISTFKEVASPPEHLRGIQFIYVGAGNQLSIKGKEKDRETEVEIKWYILSSLSGVTKLRKDLHKDTPYAERRLPFSLPSPRHSGAPQLKERYMVINQEHDVLLFSFEPAW